MKGFKSFPERVSLEFSPGVSVIVGPNGSGKSNITDAVLWALGEQSPGAIRGASMQDVISAGGKNTGQRREAQVEVVIDNSDGRAATEFSEIAVERRLDRSGDGGYRLNGARARLADVIDVLSDTNLGREMHSVISQGRVETIIHSKPRERRLLIEEAAGLGKHRKRRRRAELKLRGTRDNLDRALDVEREARARLRPLKRQAQAAEIGARIDREEMELKARIVSEELRFGADRAAAAAKAAAAARGKRGKLEEQLAEVSKRRSAAEERFAERDRARTQAWGLLTKLRAESERVAVRVAGLSRSRDRGRGAAGGAAGRARAADARGRPAAARRRSGRGSWRRSWARSTPGLQSALDGPGGGALRRRLGDRPRARARRRPGGERTGDPPRAPRRGPARRAPPGEDARPDGRRRGAARRRARGAGRGRGGRHRDPRPGRADRVDRGRQRGRRRRDRRRAARLLEDRVRAAGRRCARSPRN